ncbi:DNA alkylation response protein [Rhodobacteraceae bacterium CCMM004]|nr:DNA alkylation response protein [Rhodobacteraceae bacterium CCMM004]
MIPPTDRLETHEVTNQPPVRGDVDLWARDPVLRTYAGGGDGATLARHGAELGRAVWAETAREAERPGPELRLFDAGGRRLDEIAYSDAYHRLIALGLGAGYAASGWEGRAGGHVTHAAMVYLHSQVEPGTCCPMTMTYAAVPALAADPGLEALWRPRLTARAYDPAVAPLEDKAAATMGMAMTEKQGGSDLRATATRAERHGHAWRLTGHKWFCSAPMSDGFLTLAQAPGGLTCFVVPRWLPDRRNAVRLMRLKDKLGNRANASAEIEFAGAEAARLGSEGDGIRTILTMVHHTRLDTAMAPAGLMRAALDAAWHWCRGRRAFGAPLADQPLMRAVLADLVLDWEGATALGFAVAGAFDAGNRGFARIGVALAKFLANAMCPPVVGSAMEAMGGIGYVADTPLPMLWREAPLNGIWEGSGNVICLDILRTLARDAAAVEALAAALEAGRGAVAGYDAALAAHRDRWRQGAEPGQARRHAEETATLLTAATLIGRAPAAVAEAYVSSRLAPSLCRLPGSRFSGDPAQVLARLGPG